MEEPFKTLIWAATRAPSGDNTQPWRFVIDADAQRIDLHLDPTRDPSPMNAGQRMARIAIGAALENMLRAARGKGWSVDLEEPTPPALASVRISAFQSNGRPVDEAITERVTNRRPYDGRALPTEMLAELERQTPPVDGVRTHWICDRDRLDLLARLIGRADALMLGEPSMRRAFLDNVRFDAPLEAEVEEGLPVASLELPVMDRFALRVLPRIPDWLLTIGGACHKFAAAARKLVNSGSGLCVVVEEDGTPQTEVLSGRAMQRAWLALTAQRLGAQPVMSLAILESVLCRGSAELLASLGREKATALVEKFRAAVPEIEGGNTAFIMRFGFAPPPTARAGRLAPGALTEELRVPASQRPVVIRGATFEDGRMISHTEGIS